MARSGVLPARDALTRAVALWRGDPGDPGTLAGTRAAFLVLQLDAILAPAERVGELARSVSNLLDRIGEGTVEPNGAVVDAVSEAVDRLPYLPDDAPGAADDLLERIDAYASGMTDMEFDSTQATEGADEPPLLTVRDDGVSVTPGMFDASDTANAQERYELPIIAAAVQAIGDQLGGQLDALKAIADAGAGGELRRLAKELRATLATIEGLGRSLAAVPYGRSD